MKSSNRMLKFFFGVYALALVCSVAWGIYNAKENEQLRSALAQLKASANNDNSNFDARSASVNEVSTVKTKTNHHSDSADFSDVVTREAPSFASAPVSDANAAISKMQQESLNLAVEQKYALLLDSLHLSGSESDQLRQLLLDRERVLSASTTSYYTDDLDVMISVEQHEEMLNKIDNDIEVMLSRDDYQRYDLFKDSGLEQYQLTRFESQLEGSAALQSTQAQDLLLAKLKHKRQFLDAIASAQQIAQSGNKKAAKQGMKQAVKQYQEGYLNDAQSILTPEQLQTLTEFEAGEFDDIYMSLVAAEED